MKLVIEIDVTDPSDIPWIARAAARGLWNAADLARNDNGHDPEDCIRLAAHADRLELIAEQLDAIAERYHADQRAKEADRG